MRKGTSDITIMRSLYPLCAKGSVGLRTLFYDSGVTFYLRYVLIKQLQLNSAFLLI
jgi:hypothetical protein